jgi:hypothetical protein
MGPFYCPKGLGAIGIFIWKPRNFPVYGHTEPGPLARSAGSWLDTFYSWRELDQADAPLDYWWPQLAVGHREAVGDSRCRGGPVHQTISVHGLLIFKEKSWERTIHLVSTDLVWCAAGQSRAPPNRFDALQTRPS